MPEQTITWIQFSTQNGITWETDIPNVIRQELSPQRKLLRDRVKLIRALEDVNHGEYAARQEKLGASYASPKRTGVMDSRIMQCGSCEDWFYEIEAIRNARGLNCPWCGNYTI